MKYKIKVIKIESKEDSLIDKLYVRGEAFDRILFQADMDSDATIEILQHLHDLKDRKIVD